MKRLLFFVFFIFVNMCASQKEITDQQRYAVVACYLDLFNTTNPNLNDYKKPDDTHENVVSNIKLINSYMYVLSNQLSMNESYKNCYNHYRDMDSKNVNRTYFLSHFDHEFINSNPISHSLSDDFAHYLSRGSEILSEGGGSAKTTFHDSLVCFFEDVGDYNIVSYQFFRSNRTVYYESDKIARVLLESFPFYEHYKGQREAEEARKNVLERRIHARRQFKDGIKLLVTEYPIQTTLFAALALVLSGSGIHNFYKMIKQRK